jgi:exo-beta-1,3-glucanase (GH17 family)
MLEDNTITNDEIDIYLKSYKTTFSRIITDATFNDENLRKTLAAYIDSNNALISNIEFVIELAEVDAFNAIINDENIVRHTMLVRVDNES